MNDQQADPVDTKPVTYINTYQASSVQVDG